MTELQWLIKMLTSQKLSPGLKDMFIERIGEVEENLSKSPPILRHQPYTITSTNGSGTVQAPSMQKILDGMENGISPTIGMSPITPSIPPRQITPTEVNTGKNTRGPRKF